MMALHLGFFVTNMIVVVILEIYRQVYWGTQNFRQTNEIIGIVGAFSEFGIQVFIAFLMIKFSYPSPEETHGNFGRMNLINKLQVQEQVKRVSQELREKRSSSRLQLEPDRTDAERESIVLAFQNYQELENEM